MVKYNFDFINLTHLPSKNLDGIYQKPKLMWHQKIGGFLHQFKIERKDYENKKINIKY